MPCLQTQTGLPQSRLGLQSPTEGGQAGGTPQLVSQAHLVFAQPLEELNPSDTEQEKVRPTIHLFACPETAREYTFLAGVISYRLCTCGCTSYAVRQCPLQLLCHSSQYALLGYDFATATLLIVKLPMINVKAVPHTTLA